MTIVHNAIRSMNKRVTGGVLRGIGYGAVAMMIVTTQFEQTTIFFPIALLIVMSGMLLDSIARRERERCNNDTDEGGDTTVPPRELQLRNYIAAELSMDAIEKRYSDDWYAQNPGWWKDNNSGTLNSDSGAYE